MPLIICPSCSHSLSSEAITCPSCGHPLKQQKTESITGPSALLLGLSFVATGVCLFLLLPRLDSLILAIFLSLIPIALAWLIAMKRGYK